MKLVFEHSRQNFRYKSRRLIRTAGHYKFYVTGSCTFVVPLVGYTGHFQFHVYNSLVTLRGPEGRINEFNAVLLNLRELPVNLDDFNV